MKALVTARSSYIGKAKRVLSYGNKATQDPSSVNDFLIRAEGISEIVAGFEKVQLEIEIAEPTNLDAQEEIREEFEDLVYSIKGYFKSMSATNSNPNTQTASSRGPTVKLPELSLNVFSGSLSEWNGFADLYRSLIHNNPSLSATEKFYYLKNSLRNEPLNLIRNLPVTEANYLIAWDTLESRYQNKRLIVSHHIDQILNLPPLTSTAQGLHNFVSIITENIAALKVARVPVDSWNDLLVVIVSKKLDKATRTGWERTLPVGQLPKFEELLAFLGKQASVMEAMAEDKSSSLEHRRSQPKKNSTFAIACSSPDKCSLCKETHYIYQCPKFQNLTPNRRFELAKNGSLCLNCLRPGHRLAACASSRTCKACQGKHHSLLHFEARVGLTNSQPTTSVSENVADHQGKSVSLFTDGNSLEKTVLLPTALVELTDSAGVSRTVRALVDSASQANYISESCFQRLGLARRPYKGTIQALGDQQVAPPKGITTCRVGAGNRGETSFPIDALIVRNITSSMPSHAFSTRSWQHFENLKLADPLFNVPKPIDLLLGAAVFPFIVQGEKIQGDLGTPVAMNTIFGWILLGELHDSVNSSLRVFHLRNDTHPLGLDALVTRFWEVEELDTPEVTMTPDEERCENLYQNSYTRDSDGRYSVALPFRVESPQLGDSLFIAKRSFKSLCRRLLSNESLAKDYISFMRDYLEKGHMSLSEDQAETSKSMYYIPHHCVMKPESLTTKLRVVFDASRKSDSNLSLNDVLHAGPPLQQDLSAILLRFRFPSFVFTADIRQMYRQILIHPEHRCYQRILWNFDLTGPPLVFQLNTVTYGLNCAPFLALRTLRQLSMDERDRWPSAARILANDVYVDDIVTGADSLNEALRLQSEVIQLLAAGDFELSKWSSNDPRLLESVSSGDFDTLQTLDLADSIVKILGLCWSPKLDSFCYRIRPTNRICTKRNILSEVARIFDPLGFLTPLTFFAKCLLQKLWSHSVGWDKEPPLKIVAQWRRFQLEIPRLVRIQKCVVDLVGFCDASEAGYAAVVYFRCSSLIDNSVNVLLISGKSRVAPLKRISIPRLELCAAMLLGRLMRAIREQCHLEFRFQYAFSDSTIVLHWIRSPPHRFKTFVSNRITKIQACVAPDVWRNLRSAENPADCASRGVFPSDLLNHPLWWSGPSWLLRPGESWPVCIVSEPIDTCESLETRVKTLICTKVEDDLLDKYSSFTRLQRVTAYIFRFVRACQRPAHLLKTGDTCSPLSSVELENALLALVKLEQGNHFTQDISSLTRAQQCSKQLRKLNPFLDPSGVVRVGGRLRHASLSFKQKHPILLPQKGRLTALLVQHYHRLYLHPGVQALQSLLAQKFWILSARNVVRRETMKCLDCFHCAPKELTPYMGDLPAPRVTRARPFQTVGVDYAGPLRITLKRQRGGTIHKSYICLFVCLATKASHLELSSDLTTETFLAAFRRFIARRGRPSHVHSDCGTNFVGAKRQLSELYAFVNGPRHNQAMANALAVEGIEWHLNPPAAPHFGGIWEAGVKSVKSHLFRTIGEQILTYEELNTVLEQIEAVLNSRPLCALTSDPADLNALTPGHFLIQEPPICLPDKDLSDEPLNRLSRWQLTQRIHQDFWKRWQREYLHTLQQRNKWTSPSVPIAKGTLVLIKDELLPHLQWRLGRIEELTLDADGVPRVASVRTAMGLVQRPLVKSCPLPSQ